MITDKRENILSVVMAFSDIKGIGQVAIRTYEDYFMAVENEDDAYQLYKEIKESIYNKSKAWGSRIPDLTPDELNEKIHNAQKTLEEQTKKGIYSVFFADDFYKKLFEKDLTFQSHTNPPLYFFYKGNKNALEKRGIAIVNAYLKEEWALKISRIFGKYTAQKGWNLIIDSQDTVEVENSNCIFIQESPLEEMENTDFCDAVLKNDGCIVSLVWKDKNKIIYAAGIVEFQIALAKGIFAFGYHKNYFFNGEERKEETIEEEKRVYFNLLKGTRKRYQRHPVACYYCYGDEQSMKANNDLIAGGGIYGLNIDKSRWNMGTFLKLCEDRLK